MTDALCDPIMDCERCGAEEHESDGEWIYIGTTTVDNMIVSFDYGWVCSACAQYYREK